MARERNLKNLLTEKHGISVLRRLVPNFYVPNTDERKYVYSKLGIDFKKYRKSIDGFILKVPSVYEVQSQDDLELVEIKTTAAKGIVELPYGVFFGITENEENLFKRMDNYKLCIVHTILEKYVMLNYEEYESLIQNKRVQYQVNFKSSK